jgi:hypothetical protein
MRSAISELGWIPRRRNVFYELFEEEPSAPAADLLQTRSRAGQLPVVTTTP